jgi:helix-turn-helix protein
MAVATQREKWNPATGSWYSRKRQDAPTVAGKRMTLTPPTLGQRLRLKRTLRGWTLRELGKRSGVGYTYIWQLEHGCSEESFARVQAIEALARALGCKPSWLAGWK